MGPTVHVALVPENVQVDPAELMRVAAAVSQQVERDFSPLWNVNATVDPFSQLEEVPGSYWPILIMSNVQDAEGYHQDKNGQPFSVIAFHGQWSITASHECLEMLADPFGRQLHSGNLLDQAVQLGVQQGRIEYLVEVCDPSEDAQFSYQIDGVQVSDFYTPRFFDPEASPNTHYSFTGSIDEPRKVLDGGYISWRDPVSGDWFQLRMFPDEFSGNVPHVLNLSQETAFEKFIHSDGLRGASDRVTRPKYWQRRTETPRLSMAQRRTEYARRSQQARAKELRTHVAELIRSVRKSEQ